MKRIFIHLLIILLIFSCQRNNQWDYDSFFTQAFDIIKEKSIKKNEIEWDDLKRIVLDSIKQFNSNDDVYRALEYTIELLDDGHSQFVGPRTPNKLTIDTFSLPEIDTRIIEGGIGYIKLPGFIANTQRSKLYSIKIRESLLALDSSGRISGWIVDLRENSGGLRYMMPMGLAPLFQDSLICYNVNNNQEYFEEYCTTRYFYFVDTKVDSMNIETQLINNNEKIAVLIGPNTISSGEHLASALKYQPSTKFFGDRTKGKTTGLELIEFKSEAKLLLATVNMCNRDKEVIHGGILPNIQCEPNQALDLAIDWINKSHITGAKNEPSRPAGGYAN